ncbi:MAG TPA: TlpA disulfide reductase family protein [Flavobacterium sp.]|uniref:TlpA family protein disulfide reductase n=1 Tax=Flavobacterium sp. TaxID=239 RepID=UPI002C5DD5FB|nr:TlpA disulfide reductase family protein [Flavobacterium sp.]HNP32773.1 TlpA disulfide reductase family protein [Flavobacterium sp.]
MKQIYLIAFFLILTQTSTAQQLAVYEKFADFEKNVIRNDENVYVINFWATWCGPCVKELPFFEKLHQENKNVKVILVSLDSGKDLEKKLIPFIAKKKITTEVILLSDKDYNTWLNKIDQNWSGSIPATLLISGSRKRFAEHDFESYAELNEYINSFTNQNK